MVSAAVEQAEWITEGDEELPEESLRALARLLIAMDEEENTADAAD